MIENIKNNWIKYLILLGFLIFLGYKIYNWTFNINNIPVGDFIESVDSPNGKYTLKSYKYSGGATINWTVRVELVDNEDLKKRNIYYNKNMDYVSMFWVDNSYVIINDKKLNIHNEKYDFRIDKTN